MIRYQNKGSGLIEWLAQHGATLAEGFTDGVGVWESNKSDEEINILIEAYNPWPYEKTAKLNEINDWFTQTVELLTAGTTQRERESWGVQVNEAYGLRPVAMLRSMATQRGISLDDLISKVKAKAELYAEHYGAIQGRRDAVEDMINTFPDDGPADRLPELWALKC